MVILWKQFRFFYFWVWVGFRFGLNWVGLRFGSGLGLVWVSYLSWWFFLKYIFLRIGRYRLNRTEVFENLAFESPYLIIINIRLGSNANQFGMVYASPEKIESLTINAKRRKGQVNIDLLVYFTICCSNRPLFWASKFRKSIRYWLTALLIGRSREKYYMEDFTWGFSGKFQYQVFRSRPEVENMTVHASRVNTVYPKNFIQIGLNVF